MSDVRPSATFDLEQHRAFLTRVARQLVRGDADADDLVQATFVRALERPPAVSAALRSWLHRVAQRLAANRRRGDARRAQRELAAAPREALPAHDEALASLELQERLLAAMKALDEPYRTTLWLRWHEGLPTAAIAAREQLSVKGVEARLARGLEALRAEMDRRSGGVRARWFAGIATLAGLGGMAESAAAMTLPMAAGAWAMKKAAIAAALLLLGGAGWWWWRDEASAPTEVAQRAAPAAAVEPSPLAEPAVVADRVADPDRVAATTTTKTPLAELLVRVVGSDGAPAADVLVFAVPEAATDAPRVVFEQRSATDGLARFAGLAVGPVRVEADRGATASTTVAADVANEVELRLAGGIDVSGRVVDEAGAPVAGAEILYLSARRDWLAARVVGRSDGDGGFAVRELAPGGDLSARAAGFVPAFLERLDARGPSPRRDVTLVLDWRGVAVGGRVVDPEGRPVAGAWVAAGRNRGTNYHEGENDPSFRRRFGMATARTGDDGRFEFSGIEHGALEVAVMADGFPVQAQVLPCFVGQRSFGEIALEAPATVELTVIAPDGAPIVGAEVAVAALREHGAKWLPFPLPRAVTDTAGAAVLRLVGPGKVSLRVAPPTGSRWNAVMPEVTAVSGSSVAHVVRLGVGSVIHGRVVDDAGAGVSGMELRWRPTMGGRPLVVSVAEDGGFRLEPCDEPPYTVQLVETRRRKVVLTRSGLSPGDDAIELVVPRFAAIVGAFIESEVDEAAMKGATRAEGAESVSPSRVPLKPECFAMDRANEHGANAEWSGDNFTCRDLPPGTYRLTIRGEEAQLYQSEWITLAAGEVRDLGLVRSQRERDALPGVVELALTDRGAGAVSVALLSSSFDPVSGLEPGTDGVWRAEHVLPGEWWVVVFSEKCATVLVPFTVEAGATAKQAVELEPGTPRTLRFDGEWADLAVTVRDEKGGLCGAKRLTSIDPKGLLLMLRDGRYTVDAVSDRGQRAQGGFEIAALAPQEEVLAFALR